MFKSKNKKIYVYPVHLVLLYKSVGVSGYKLDPKLINWVPGINCMGVIIMSIEFFNKCVEFS